MPSETASTAARRRKVLRLADRLSARFGKPGRAGRGDLLDALVETLLSQSTTDHNRDIAFRSLKKTFADWEEVADAPQGAIARAIRSAGLGNQKAGRIRDFLRRLREDRGRLSLEFLHREPDDFAVRYLTRHKGVGVKTAYVALMLASNRDLFAIDVHIHRIMIRLGVIGEKTTPEKSHAELAPLVPKGRARELHVNMLRFGRTICAARSPKCGECDLRRMCRYYRETRPGRRAAGEAPASRKPAE